MKNDEMYVTPEEREKAFMAFCRKNKCESCPLSIRQTIGCTLPWLSMEADDGND